MSQTDGSHSDPNHVEPTRVTNPLNYATAGTTAQPGAAWAAILLGVLSLIPVLFWFLVETGLVHNHKLWFDARDELMFFGSMALGPILGSAALLLAGPPKRHVGPPNRIRNFARVCGGASVVLGTGMSLLACAFAWPFVILNVLLIVGMRMAWYRL